MNNSAWTGSPRQIDSRASSNTLLEITKDSGKIGTYIGSSNSQTTYLLFNSMPVSTGLIQDKDPETAAMTDAEILAAVREMAGSWKDRPDITDTWLDEMRDSWDDRLGDLYDNSESSL